VALELEAAAGKVVLITGAARRIGAQIARTLHGQGFDLVLHYRTSRAEADALRSDLEATRQGSILVVQADLKDCGGFDAVMAQVRDFRGRLDVLVNNASDFYPTPFATSGEEEWEDLMGSNLKGPYFLTRAAAPLLREAGGCVVNLVDIYAERPLKSYPIYSIAKAGNAMMVRALARELAPAVRVNGVAPGVILWPEEEPPDHTRREILARTALRRMGSPDDIARAVLFLVRDADYVTGQIIAVDGGRTLQQ